MILDSSDFEKKEGLKFHIIAFLCQNSDFSHFAYITIIEWKRRHLTFKVASRIGPFLTQREISLGKQFLSDDRNKYTKGRTGRRSKKRKGENQEHIPREPLLCWGVILYDDASRLGSFFFQIVRLIAILFFVHDFFKNPYLILLVLIHSTISI